MTLVAVSGADAEWLAICSKCVTPTIFSKTGIGTSHAGAEARITRKDIDEWCENWSAPGNKDCAKDQLAQYDLKEVYRASADCKAGRIVTIDGESYTLAGIWDGSDIGGGRTKWRDKNGAIISRDNASGGLGISQQWEVLCPGPPPEPTLPAIRGPS